MKKALSVILMVAMIICLAYFLAIQNRPLENTLQIPSDITGSTQASETPAPAPEEKPQSARTRDIAIICTNDVHCCIKDNIGYAGVSQIKKDLIAAGKDVILVDAGDFVHGTTYGSLSYGEIPINIMNRLGYDAVTLGNHEFNYGFSVLKERQEQANFPFLAMNIFDTSTNSLVYEPYTIIEKDGVKIGFIGIVTPIAITRGDSSIFLDSKGNPLYSFLQDDSGNKLWKAVQSTVDEVRAKGVDYVIAVSHLGNIDSFVPYLSTDCIAKVSGIDAYIDGHSHTVIEGEKVPDAAGKSVLLTQAGSDLKYVGVMTIDTDGKFSYKIIDHAEADPEMLAYINEECAVIDNALGSAFAEITQDLSRKDPVTDEWIGYQNECNIGDMCADALRYYTGSDICVINAGSIRNDLKKGKVTYKDVLDVFPFNNSVIILEVDGQHILDMLEISVSKSPEEFSEFLHVSGLSFKFTNSIPSPVNFDDDGNASVPRDAQRRVKEVLIDGKPLDVNKKYTLTSVAYTMFNDKAYQTLMSDCIVINPFFSVDYDVLVNYLKDVYPTVSSNYDNRYGAGRIVAE